MFTITRPMGRLLPRRLFLQASLLMARGTRLARIGSSLGQGTETVVRRSAGPSDASWSSSTAGRRSSTPGT